MASAYNADSAVDPSRRRYSGVAMAFHWAIAILVIMNWQIAERAGNLAGPTASAVWNYHKAWGITILALTLGRIAWKLAHPGPPFPAHYKPWERVLARTVHFTFYALLLALPLAGWLANSFNGRTIDFFGLFTIPALPVGANKELGGAIFDLHATTGKALLLLVGLHILGVVKHLVIDRDGELFRMLPFGRVGKKA
mgnify:CR=1 FL=1